MMDWVIDLVACEILTAGLSVVDREERIHGEKVPWVARAVL